MGRLTEGRVEPRVAGFGSEGKSPVLGCSMEGPQAVLSLLQALRYFVRLPVAHWDDQKTTCGKLPRNHEQVGSRAEQCHRCHAPAALALWEGRHRSWSGSLLGERGVHPGGTRSSQPRAARPACVPRTYPSTRCSPEPFLALSRGDLGWGQHRVDSPPAAGLRRTAKQPKMAASSAPSSDPKPAPRSPCWRGGRGGGVAATVVAEGRGCSAGGTERTCSPGQLALQGILSSRFLPGLSLVLSVPAYTALFCAFIYSSMLQY